MNDKIISIVVTNLFGFLNHNVELKPGGITLVHGPNGCGKTTFLNMIARFFEYDFASLRAFYFETLEFHYPDQMLLKIVKSIDQELDDPILTFFLLKQDVVLESFSSVNEQQQRWQQLPQQLLLQQEPLPSWLKELASNTMLHFIQTQRLLKINANHGNDKTQVSEVIEIYSDEIVDKISQSMNKFSKVTQTQDRSFPEQLLTLSAEKSLTEEQIRQDYKETEEKIEKLMRIGLIESDENIALPDKTLEAVEKKVLSLYLQNINEKFAIFDDLLQKVETFLEIVATKLRNKRLRLSPNKGFLLETTQGGSRSLTAKQLSSGEQHQIVLFYELIFKTDDHCLILIDEPEISLHVDWQRQFLSDLEKVTALGHHSFLIATHSPQIIGNRRDLAVPLDGGILSEMRDEK